MNFSFFIARRYVFAKKSHNAINVIAAISIAGITVGTIAFITVLSVFNGFDSVVRSMFNSFYADMEIVPQLGKTFIISEEKISQLRNVEDVLDIGSIVQENALLVYGNRQTIGTVRGVSDNYADITGIDTMVIDGKYLLSDNGTPYAVVGRGIKYMLNMDISFVDVLKLIVPKRTKKIYLDQNRALNTKLIRPSGFFISQPELEIKYVIVPLKFAQTLFDYKNEISALEIKLDPDANLNRVQKKLQEIAGPDLYVKNRIQQNELLYKTMKSEKWAIFFILVFVLLVASFNVVGSLTMLIIEKKNDIQTLRHLGSNMNTIRKTFLIEGLMISFIGAIVGLVIGSLICFLQQEYGIVKLQGAGSFIIDAYPVKIMFRDILLVLISISAIGFIASWYPIRFITRRYLTDEKL
ncbi:MAG: ABC transporter permease [Bacteroidales bacterium]|nr:ABC transporter permease [Bacteroidales bacterium]